MPTPPTHDPHAGTVYRQLLGAEDAVGLARFHGAHVDGIGYDPAAAIAAIDVAIAQLRAARAQLAAEVR